MYWDSKSIPVVKHVFPNNIDLERLEKGIGVGHLLDLGEGKL